ncbi:hypothetical protein SAMN05421841_3051 [Chryseobacterium wanjuense]|uniref:Uncharacterized protein n=1 Tax=Chryseobacterium wanjuense TaxID=356305 RepID=A0A1I0RPW2_9FLAO|nr:hypothetical protein [Chryseobacterium wanjuense]SEW43311.1 hypothetical protein SAMN05421841_3051 [Chryseobacterium wanjuense]
MVKTILIFILNFTLLFNNINFPSKYFTMEALLLYKNTTNMEKRGEKPSVKYLLNISIGLHGNNRLVNSIERYKDTK